MPLLLPPPSPSPAYLYEAGIGWATLREPNGWRWMVAALVLPAALLAIAMLFVSESPFWLVTRGRYGEVGSGQVRVGCLVPLITSRRNAAAGLPSALMAAAGMDLEALHAVFRPLF